MSIIEEIKAYFKANGIKQGDIASACDWKKSFVSELLNGKRSIGNETAVKLNKAYKFDIQWLLTGEGTMFRFDATASTEEEEIAKATDMYKAMMEELARMKKELEDKDKFIEKLNERIDMQDNVIKRLLSDSAITPSKCNG